MRTESSSRLQAQILLGHQVHPVLERSDQGDVGGPVEGQQFRLAEAAEEVVHRHPTHLRVAPVDLAHQSFDLQLQFVVLGYAHAAGDHHLEQVDASSHFGKPLQKVGEGS